MQKTENITLNLTHIELHGYIVGQCWGGYKADMEFTKTVPASEINPEILESDGFIKPRLLERHLVQKRNP